MDRSINNTLKIMSQINTKNKIGEISFKVSRFKEIIKRTKPHKHDHYYELIFLHSGEGVHEIEGERFNVNCPELFLLRPGQMHYWQFTKIPKGFVILCKTDEFDPIQEPHILRGLQLLMQYTHIPLNNETYPLELLDRLTESYKSTGEYRNEVIHGEFQSLIYRMAEVAHNSDTSLTMTSSAFHQFETLLIQNINTLHRVNEYAGLMCTTPQNINAICKKEKGLPASEIINNMLLIEAKRYLLYTDSTIESVSETLSFSSATQFIRFFKKHSGLTPLQYRLQYGFG